MFIGHPALGLASKKVAPQVSLGLLVAAPMLLDLLWPIFLLLGIEHVRIQPGVTILSPLNFTDYPWSHSLAMTIVWGILFGGGYWIVRRSGRGALILFLGVVSHWVCDWLVHRPDLPLWPGGPKVGLGLWNHPIAEIAIESAIFAIGILIYRDTTRPLDRIGSLFFWLFVIVLAALYIFGASGKPPANVKQLAWGALAIEWLLPIWAWWFDRHRAVYVREP